MRTASYVSLGVGVVGVAAGTIFALSSSSKRSEADDLYAEHCNPACDVSDPAAQKVAELDDSAGTAKTLSIVSFVVGGLGLAAGGTLFFLSAKKEASAQAFSIRPVVGFGSAGVTGSF